MDNGNLPNDEQIREALREHAEIVSVRHDPLGDQGDQLNWWRVVAPAHFFSLNTGLIYAITYTWQHSKWQTSTKVAVTVLFITVVILLTWLLYQLRPS